MRLFCSDVCSVEGAQLIMIGYQIKLSWPLSRVRISLSFVTFFGLKRQSLGRDRGQ